MKFNLLYTSFLALGLIGTACTDESDYLQEEPEEKTTSSLEVYFYPASTTSYDLGEDDTSLSVDVYRADASEAKTYAIQYESADKSLFNVPATVSFPKGEVKTSFEFNFVASNLTPMEATDITFIVGDGVNTPWAYQKLTYALTYLPWNDVLGENGEEYATWHEDFLTTVWIVPDEYSSWNVKLQSSPAVKGLYRVVNPYENSEYFGPYDDDEKHYFYFNASDPNCVFVCDQKGNALDGSNPAVFDVGIDFGGNVGYITVMGLYNDAIAAEESADEAALYAGTLKDGVLKFPAKSFILTGTGSSFDGWYYSNTKGDFRIIWPGAVEAEEEWEPIGKGQYTDVLITSLYAEDETDPTSATWTVDVEQSKENPGRYRMVNPYKDGVMPGGLNYDGDMYFVFDASNPDCVLVDEQLIFNMDVPLVGGDIYAGNYAGYLASNGFSADEIIAKELNDTFKNNEFNFGPGNLYLYFPNTTNEEWVDAMLSFSDDAGKLVLSDDATENAAANYNRTLSSNSKISRNLSPVGVTARINNGIKVFPAGRKAKINL